MSKDDPCTNIKSKAVRIVGLPRRARLALFIMCLWSAIPIYWLIHGSLLNMLLGIGLCLVPLGYAVFLSGRAHEEGSSEPEP